MTDEKWIDNATGSKIVGKDQDGVPGEVSLKRTAGGQLAVVTAIADGAGNGVIGSDYDGDKSVTTASQREAVPTGAKSVEVYNQGPTNFMRFRFGDSTVDATVTTGFFVDAGERLSVPVPGSATHWAYIADTAGVTASVVWGG